MSYTCATYVIEAVAAACADTNGGKRKGTYFPKKNYVSDEQREQFNQADSDIKDSPFYIRQKLEYSSVVEQFAGKGAKSLVIFIMIIYMYGAMCLKYVSGAESFEQAVSFIIYHNDKIYKDDPACAWEQAWYGYFDPYFLGLFVFAFLSIMFSFGDIENSKILQAVSMYLRFFVTIVMMIGSLV